MKTNRVVMCGWILISCAVGMKDIATGMWVAGVGAIAMEAVAIFLE